MTREMFEHFIEDLIWRHHLENLGIDLGIDGANLLKYCWYLFNKKWSGIEASDLVDEYIRWANDDEEVPIPNAQTSGGYIIWVTSTERLWEALNEVYGVKNEE